jgi:hypothetical protein
MAVRNEEGWMVVSVMVVAENKKTTGQRLHTPTLHTPPLHIPTLHTPTLHTPTLHTATLHTATLHTVTPHALVPEGYTDRLCARSECFVECPPQC